MRGEHFTEPGQLVVDPGSPPHARGALVLDAVPATPTGITPACAGSTASATAARAGDPDHPRMRGEHVRHRLRVCFAQWITPACAGSTVAAAGAGARTSDHPRMRGEHATSTMTARIVGGSPPHARGALYLTPPPLAAGGITPACAGSTCGPAATARRARDHPRMRGEHGGPPSSR